MRWWSKAGCSLLATKVPAGGKRALRLKQAPEGRVIFCVSRGVSPCAVVCCCGCSAVAQPAGGSDFVARMALSVVTNFILSLPSPSSSFSFFLLLRPAGNIPLGVMNPSAFVQIHMAVFRRCAEKVIGKERIFRWVFGFVESVLISCSRLENSPGLCFSK